MSNAPKDRSQRLIVALVSGIQAHEGKRIAGYEIANALRVTPATLSKWMNGRTRLEQIEWLLRLLNKLPEDRWLRELKEALKQRSPAVAREKHFRRRAAQAVRHARKEKNS